MHIIFVQEKRRMRPQIRGEAENKPSVKLMACWDRRLSGPNTSLR